MAWTREGQAWTGSTEWLATRRAVLDRDRHTCQLRLEIYCEGTATELDHIRPVASTGAVDIETICDTTNLRAICKPCHAIKTQHDRTGKPLDPRDYQRVGYSVSRLLDLVEPQPQRMPAAPVAAPKRKRRASFEPSRYRPRPAIGIDPAGRNHGG